MSNMSESKVVIQGKIDTPNGLGVDWIANNIYWTDNEYKVRKIQWHLHILTSLSLSDCLINIMNIIIGFGSGSS